MMKVKFELDCTPEEARYFFGLPNVEPMQQAVMAKMEAQMLEAAERYSPEGLLRSWLSFGPFSPEQVRSFMQNFNMTAPSPSAPAPAAKPATPPAPVKEKV